MWRKLAFPVATILLLGLAETVYAQCSVPQGQTEIVTTSVSCGQMSIAGTLIIESTGSITGTENSTLNGSGATITVNGGSFTINGRFNVGQGSDGYINMNGGTFTVTGTFKFPDDSGGEHRIYLNGGIMHAGDIEQKHDRDAIIYVGGGILRLDDITGEDRDPHDWKNNGDLLPAEGYDEIVIEDKGTYTEITALPSGPRVQFETATSEGLESVSPAVLTVTLSNAEAGETYTVDYAVAGGTATGGGVDYSLTPDTLTFNPGQTSLPIEFAVVNDGLDENDETVIVELSNPTGPDVLLGNTTQHTYTILDPRPGVGFAQPAGSGSEDVTPAAIAVSISSALGDTVTVDYAVTGGTATGGGTDYTLMGSGTLTFAPWDTSETISMSIVDDSIEEIPSETVELTLSNPSSNVKLSLQNQHTYTIIDNEAGVVWDGLTWYYSKDPPTALFVNASGQLEWSPEKGEQFITRLPEQDFSYTGAVVEVSYLWMTDGDHDCPDCFACPDGCYDDSIECIAGTSDMRVGLFEADGEYITNDGFDTSSSIFTGYKGYAWRFGPNMKAGPTRWVDCHGEVHKTGNFQKKAASTSNLMTTNDGLEDYIPGFELPPGEWSLFTIRLERLSSSSVELSITLNDRTYTWTDGSSSGQPQKIDVLAVHMRNGRPYSRLVLDSLWQPPPQAWDPYPLDGAEGQPVGVVLTWKPGLYMGDYPADKHLLYFGTSYEDVNKAVVDSPEYCCCKYVGWEQFDPTSDMGATVELWHTYYWRIDEKPFGQSLVKGQVWSFTTGTDMTAASSPSPPDGAENVDPNVVLKWKPGQHATSHDVYFGTDFEAVQSADVSSSEYKGNQNFDANSYAPLGLLDLATTYYWRIDEISGNDVLKGEMWRFTVDDGKARDPNPEDGVWIVSTDITLSWTPGALAASHDVYFCTDSNDVNDANGSSHPNVDYDNVVVATYEPCLVELGQTYYWRIDEVNNGNLRKGDIWNFIVVEYIVVDDMESYTPGWDSPHPIRDRWADGCDNRTGSCIWLQTNTPVRDTQSMEYWYDNTWDFGAGCCCSEIESISLEPNDWAELGVKILSLWFYGNQDNDAGDTEQMYVGVEDTNGLYSELEYGDGEGEDMNDVKIAEWQQWDIPLTYFSDGNFAAVANDVNLASMKKLFIGFGDRDNQSVPGGEGTVYFDDIRLYPPRCVPEFGPYADLSGNCIVDFADIEAMADDWLYVGLAAADLYEDNTVDLKDFAVLANSWLDEQLWPPEE